ncbi:VWA domain-containing protein [Dactylosporangium sp. AC04546]|uniref:VWA domain-containing protein n=1 Tax=Dactylosporangium sp. AC04546 TaxID=2862460 RepID=UPI001EE05D21|nr:VWA domain-containing protein [Dactylosporangium sp. AC04546]WVK88841.1 VWA domain-containing protein [Dactylosporangium sp. AC04546]
MTAPMPAFIHELVTRLRRRGLPLGVDDCGALRTALAAGHGLASGAELLRLCVTLWAKSPRDAELIVSTLHLVEPPRWSVTDTAIPPPLRTADDPVAEHPSPTDRPPTPTAAQTPAPVAPVTEALTVTVPPRRGGAAGPPRSGRATPFLVLRPQYPISEREVAQTWRRLRRPVRHGPATELDVPTTITRYAQTGVVTAPVLVPPRANAARLLLLVDRHGSMTPFHGLVDHVVDSITRAARLDAITAVYFRNTPGRSRDRSALADLQDTLTATLDPVLDRIPPLPAGRVYRDPDLTEPRPLQDVLDGVTAGTAVTIISDAGALRGSFVATRLFDSLAFLLAVLARRAHVAWLNPLTADRWPETTAGQIARHVPMFPLDRAGMYGAVDVLRGRPATVERPL